MLRSSPLLALLLSLCWLLESTPLSAQPLVTVHKVRSQTLERTLSLVGTITPRRQLNIQSQRAGRVAKIHVQENQEVAAQALLLTLDQEEVRLQQEVAELQQELRQNALRDAQENLRDAQRRLNQEEQLFARGTTTRARLDQVQLQATRAGLAVAAAQLQVDLATRELALQQRRLQDYSIRSPVAGLITQQRVEIGEVLPAGATLFELLQLGEIEIQVGVPEEDLRTLREGQPFRFQTPAFPGDVFQGNVLKIGWSADPQTRRFPVTLLAANPQRRLRVGMSAQVEIPQQLSDQLRVPPNALRYEGPQAYVFKLREQRLVRANVTAGGSYQGEMLVFGDLAPGDLVVTSRERLEEGMVVKAITP